MRFLTNRIVISFFVILGVTYFWEFYVRPVTAPIYTQAVSEYRRKNHARSLQLLEQAYQIDPNDAAILGLMGWNFLKLDQAKNAEPYFARAHRLAPRVLDVMLGYAYAQIALKKYEQAAALLKVLQERGVDTADLHVAWATLYREVGRNRDAAREFRIALALEKNNPVAVRNLREMYNAPGDGQEVSLDFQPLVRAKELTYPARVEGERLAWREDGAWSPVYLAGVNLTASLPGHFPADSPTDSALYADWFAKISGLGANTVRVYTILPPAFYRALFQFNNTRSRKPLRLLQGISFDDPPQGDFFNHQYYAACQKEIREAIDVIHGQGDVGLTNQHASGLYTNDVASWVTGFIIGKTWTSNMIEANSRLHPDMRSFQGTYVEVQTGNPTEVFLGQMIDFAAQYEETKYNWQHPIAFLNWPPLDPMRHPTESTTVEEATIRRRLGERFPFPGGPYEDDDSVTLNPMHLRARERFPAAYFAAYSVFPSYPDFMNLDPAYQRVRDAQGKNPFLGYLLDLKAHHRGLPLLIAGYEVSTSLGVGHLSRAGFDQGAKSEQQQGRLLARFTRNIYDAGAAGGLVFEWLDQWFRQGWPARSFEVPAARKLLWKNFMDPAEHYGLMAAETQRRAVRLLSGEPAEWAKQAPLYSEIPQEPRPAANLYDPARDLKAVFVDADEGFLYLRLVVRKLDNDNDGRPDWNAAHYLIGISTLPGQAGLATLPFIAGVRFPMGITYAIHLSGPTSSEILVASTYHPYQIAPIKGTAGQTELLPRLSWQAKLANTGGFEPQIIEPNRRRFGRDGTYFPAERYNRGALRYGTLNPRGPDYDSLAEWHSNARTGAIDLRIPWNLLNVTDPSSHQVVAGIAADGTVQTTETPGFLIVVFSYRPRELSRLFPVMEQNHPISDALPGMAGPDTVLETALRRYRWPGWDSPRFELRLKDSYPILRAAFLELAERR